MKWINFEGKSEETTDRTSISSGCLGRMIARCLTGNDEGDATTVEQVHGNERIVQGGIKWRKGMNWSGERTNDKIRRQETRWKLCCTSSFPSLPRIRVQIECDNWYSSHPSATIISKKENLVFDFDGWGTVTTSVSSATRTIKNIIPWV